VTNWAYLASAAGAAVLASRSHARTVAILLGGAACGVIIALPSISGVLPRVRVP
jgi:hypothetical protein